MSKEAVTTSKVLLEAAQTNTDLWRNNSGGFYNDRGGFVRYGLGSFTEKDELKSSDYVGITPVLITPEMVGTFVGVFTAVEMKPKGWKFNSNDKRSLYQKNFIDIVKSRYAYAGFAQDIEDYRKIVRNG